jgi:hypothetical protein
VLLVHPGNLTNQKAHQEARRGSGKRKESKCYVYMCYVPNANYQMSFIYLLGFGVALHYFIFLFRFLYGFQ